jgi:predicted dehydrogenase
MSDKVKLAFVGTGDVFLKYYLPEAIEQDVFEIAAICDVVRDRAERVAEFVGGAEAYESYDEMLERSDAELIAIVTPPTSHYPLALAGLEAGKHVYVEKPFCRHLDQANHLVETARRKGVHLMAAPTVLLDPPNIVMRDLIREGAIGKVAFAVSPSFQLGGAAPGYFDRFLRQLKFSSIEVLARPEEKTDASWYYQKGGGPVYDLAVYSITQMTGLLGPVRRVVAFSGTVDPHRMLMGGTEEARQIDVTEDDNTSFLLDLGDSRFVYVNAAWHGGGSRAQGMEIVGSAGTITTSGSGDLVTRTREATVHLYQNEAREWQDLPVEGELWWIPTGLTHLAHCILEGRQPEITIEHARHVVEVMEKVYVAAETGQAQEITTTF